MQQVIVISAAAGQYSRRIQNPCSYDQTRLGGVFAAFLVRSISVRAG
jgi:hypothetical protein